MANHFLNKPLRPSTLAIKLALWVRTVVAKSTLFALIKDELSIDAGNFSKPAHWEMAWVAQETPALERSAIEYVIDGDREYRRLESDLADAEQKDNGTLVAENSRQD